MPGGGGGGTSDGGGGMPGGGGIPGGPVNTRRGRNGLGRGAWTDDLEWWERAGPRGVCVCVRYVVWPLRTAWRRWHARRWRHARRHPRRWWHPRTARHPRRTCERAPHKRVSVRMCVQCVRAGARARAFGAVCWLRTAGRRRHAWRRRHPRRRRHARWACEQNSRNAHRAAFKPRRGRE
eukprot:3029867-Prymnesium_polylepis.1